MATFWIKANTVPESIGSYDPTNCTLTINGNVKIYEGKSFTKPVKALIPARSGLSVSFVGSVTMDFQLGSADKSWGRVSF